MNLIQMTEGFKNMDFKDFDNNNSNIPFITPDELSKLMQTRIAIKRRLNSGYIVGEFASCLIDRTRSLTVANDPIC